MKKYEYKKERFLLTEELNSLGLEGWELIHVNGHFLFKREITELANDEFMDQCGYKKQYVKKAELKEFSESLIREKLNQILNDKCVACTNYSITSYSIVDMNNEWTSNFTLSGTKEKFIDELIKILKEK